MLFAAEGGLISQKNTAKYSTYHFRLAASQGPASSLRTPHRALIDPPPPFWCFFFAVFFFGISEQTDAVQNEALTERRPPPLQAECCDHGLLNSKPLDDCRCLYAIFLLLLFQPNILGPNCKPDLSHSGTMASSRAGGGGALRSHMEGILFVGSGLRKPHYHPSRSRSATPLGKRPQFTRGSPSGPFRCAGCVEDVGNAGVFPPDVGARTCADFVTTLLACRLEPSASSLQMKFLRLRRCQI